MVPSLPVRPAGPRSAAARAGCAVRAAAFWIAVALPLLVIVALAVGGDLTLVALLLACNAAALVVGHGYRSPETDDRRNHDH